MAKSISKLGIGPMSEEVIEAVFRCSEEQKEPLMLIASKNQIDWDKGYVNQWTTKEYANYVQRMKNKYSGAKVYLCRDHCGPGFKNSDLKDAYKTIDTDIENGFDLIHIDFCYYKGSKKEILKESQKAIEYIHKKNPDILIEIGTDENKGDFLDNLSAVEDEMKFFNNIAPICFFVVQTGSLIKEFNQVGSFNENFIKKVHIIADKYDLKLKEHNADYLNEKKINKRKRLIDALNVAPQYGVIQTSLTIQKCLQYGINFDDFLEDSYKSRKWEKWLYTNTADNKFLCAVVAGHYVFSNYAYKSLYDKISKYENFRETIIQGIMKNFKIYLDNL